MRARIIQLKLCDWREAVYNNSFNLYGCFPTRQHASWLQAKSMLYVFPYISADLLTCVFFTFLFVASLLLVLTVWKLYLLFCNKMSFNVIKKEKEWFIHYRKNYYYWTFELEICCHGARTNLQFCKSTLHLKSQCLSVNANKKRQTSLIFETILTVTTSCSCTKQNQS